MRYYVLSKSLVYIARSAAFHAIGDGGAGIGNLFTECVLVIVGMAERAFHHAVTVAGLALT